MGGFRLMMQPRLEMRIKKDGSGFEFRTAYKDHHGHLQIGNVSVAFDDRNDWCNRESCSRDTICVELFELADDPVQLNGTSVTDISDPADKLLFALAADRGYRLEKIKR